MKLGLSLFFLAAATLCSITVGYNIPSSPRLLQDGGLMPIEASPECEQDTVTLKTIAAVAQAWEAFDTTVSTINPEDQCELDFMNLPIKLTCDIDFSKIVTDLSMAQVCNDNGGTFVDFNASFECTNDSSLSGLELNIEIQMKSTSPVCVAKTCSKAELELYKQYVEENISEQVTSDGSTCTESTFEFVVVGGDDSIDDTIAPVATDGLVAPAMTPAPVAATTKAPTVIVFLPPVTIANTKPSTVPSESPSTPPSFIPSLVPTFRPSVPPSSVPTSTPSSIPSRAPSNMPSVSPSNRPNASPSLVPSTLPSRNTSTVPSDVPTDKASLVPSTVPSVPPTVIPSEVPLTSEPFEKSPAVTRAPITTAMSALSTESAAAAVFANMSLSICLIFIGSIVLIIL